jgi:hypothetical protein
MAKEEGAPQRRLKKREIERLRRARQREIIAVAAVILVVAGVGAAVMLSPPPVPQHPPGPQEIISNTPMHIHPRLYVRVDGAERQIPPNIGLQGGAWASHDLDHWLDLREGAQGQLSPLHTHDSSGTIHVEAAVTRGFTLGEFFAVWGQPLGPDQTWNLRADAQHSLTLTVNGNGVSDWQNVVLADNQQIVINYNTVA